MLVSVSLTAGPQPLRGGPANQEALTRAPILPSSRQIVSDQTA